MSDKISEGELMLINIIADIRVVTGVNEKPMLSELPEAIDRAIKDKMKSEYIRGFNDGNG